MTIIVAHNLKAAKEVCKDNSFLKKIEDLDTSLYKQFSNALVIDECLTRKLVSFQANKTCTHYRWYKYKEAFSADLIEYLLRKYNVNKGKILDPFAGAGTALFTCSSLGNDAEGIEVLPVGQKIIEANIIARGSQKRDIAARLEHWILQRIWNTGGGTKDFEILRITDGAYSKETDHKIKRFLYELECEEPEAKEVLLFALLCVLESISYTRKDGQYLRWDYRSGRRKGKNTFDKGKILSFDEAITKKLKEIKNDISLGSGNKDLFSLKEQEVRPGDVVILKGSCLDILPQASHKKSSMREFF